MRILNTLPYRGSSENRWAATRDRGEPLSWNMSPFQGQFPPPPSAQQFVNSFNSLLRRPRPTSNRGAAPQPPCSNSLIRPPPLRRPSIYLYCSPFSSPRRPKKRNPTAPSAVLLLLIHFVHSYTFYSIPKNPLICKLKVGFLRSIRASVQKNE